MLRRRPQHSTKGLGGPAQDTTFKSPIVISARISMTGLRIFANMNFCERISRRIRVPGSRRHRCERGIQAFDLWRAWLLSGVHVRPLSCDIRTIMLRRFLCGLSVAVLAAAGILVSRATEGAIPSNAFDAFAVQAAHSAPNATHLQVTDSSDSILARVCRNDPVNNVDPLGLVESAARENVWDLLPTLRPTLVEDEMWVPQINGLLRFVNGLNAGGNQASAGFEQRVLAPYREASLQLGIMVGSGLESIDDISQSLFQQDTATLFQNAAQAGPIVALPAAVPYALSRAGTGLRVSLGLLARGGRAASGPAEGFAGAWGTARTFGSRTGSMSIGPASWDGAPWTAPRIGMTSHGQLTNGRYVLDDAGMVPHVSGSLARGKSQFLYRINEKQVVLDAAAYADKAGLWVGNKAKIVLNQPVGVVADSGELTSILNLYRTKTGFVHGAPGSP